MIMRLFLRFFLLGAILSTVACSGDTETDNGSVTIYSAREEVLIGPLIETFEIASGIEVKVKYGKNSGLAATIREEGSNTPADVFISTDPGLLGSMSDILSPLPPDILNLVPTNTRSEEGKWVGISGRARVVVYNTQKLSEADLPNSILDFTDPKWKGRIGWPPTNGSFQAFVTAMRVTLGEDITREWLKGIQANEPKVYPKNTPTVLAASQGEIDVGFVNHYYLHRFLAEEGKGFSARNYHTQNGDIGALMLVNGAGILESSKQSKNAETFLAFMLSPAAQKYLAQETHEYPLVAGIRLSKELKPLDQLELPDVALSKLTDVKGTQALLRELNIIP